MSNTSSKMPGLDTLVDFVAKFVHGSHSQHGRAPRASTLGVAIQEKFPGCSYDRFGKGWKLRNVVEAAASRGLVHLIDSDTGNYEVLPGAAESSVDSGTATTSRPWQRSVSPGNLSKQPSTSASQRPAVKEVIEVARQVVVACRRAERDVSISELEADLDSLSGWQASHLRPALEEACMHGLIVSWQDENGVARFRPEPVWTLGVAGRVGTLIDLIVAAAPLGAAPCGLTALALTEACGSPDDPDTAVKRIGEVLALDRNMLPAFDRLLAACLNNASVDRLEAILSIGRSFNRPAAREMCKIAYSLSKQGRHKRATNEMLCRRLVGRNGVKFARSTILGCLQGGHVDDAVDAVQSLLKVQGLDRFEVIRWTMAAATRYQVPKLVTATVAAAVPLREWLPLGRVHCWAAAGLLQLGDAEASIGELRAALDFADTLGLREQRAVVEAAGKRGDVAAAAQIFEAFEEFGMEQTELFECFPAATDAASHTDNALARFRALAPDLQPSVAAICSVPILCARQGLIEEFELALNKSEHCGLGFEESEIEDMLATLFDRGMVDSLRSLLDWARAQDKRIPIERLLACTSGGGDGERLAAVRLLSIFENDFEHFCDALLSGVSTGSVDVEQCDSVLDELIRLDRNDEAMILWQRLLGHDAKPARKLWMLAVDLQRDLSELLQGIGEAVDESSVLSPTSPLPAELERKLVEALESHSDGPEPDDDAGGSMWDQLFVAPPPSQSDEVDLEEEAAVEPESALPPEQPVEPGIGDQAFLSADLFGELIDGTRSSSPMQAPVSKENWDRVFADSSIGDPVSGTVEKKVNGGLIVDVDGFPAFMPASQVDVRRPNEIGEYVGRVVQCEIVKIDTTRRQIIISRRKLIERQRSEDGELLLRELEVGQVRKGIVMNIADFGAFVDLGGIDGLLHITDMAWQRISHPSELVSMGQEIEVKVLHIDCDKDKKKIALGLKQLVRDPWENIKQRYPDQSVHRGEVVNVMSYGAFVSLEPGIEGLVHISDMSWTKRIKHPSEMVAIGDVIDVKILKMDPEGQQLSLGMKQIHTDPWEGISERYPDGMDVQGKVRNLVNYGAFVELEEGIDGLIHTKDMSWTRKISHPNEMFENGQVITCRVLSVDEPRRRIALGYKQLQFDPWVSGIPDKFTVGSLVKGTVTNATNFGIFVELEPELEGLLHVSELADEDVEADHPISVGDEVEVRILRIDVEERKIALSRLTGERQPREIAEDESEEFLQKFRTHVLGVVGESVSTSSAPTAIDLEAAHELVLFCGRFVNQTYDEKRGPVSVDDLISAIHGHFSEFDPLHFGLPAKRWLKSLAVLAENRGLISLNPNVSHMEFLPADSNGSLPSADALAPTPLAGDNQPEMTVPSLSSRNDPLELGFRRWLRGEEAGWNWASQAEADYPFAASWVRFVEDDLMIVPDTPSPPSWQCLRWLLRARQVESQGNSPAYVDAVLRALAADPSEALVYDSIGSLPLSPKASRSAADPTDGADPAELFDRIVRWLDGVSAGQAHHHAKLLMQLAGARGGEDFEEAYDLLGVALRDTADRGFVQLRNEMAKSFNLNLQHGRVPPDGWKFCPDQEIHKGAFTCVYQVRPQTEDETGGSLSDRYALKHLWLTPGDPSIDHAIVAAFDREMDLLSRIRHPNVARFHNRIGRRAALLEWCIGRRLDPKVDNLFTPGTAWEAAQLKDFALRIADGFAHVAQVVDVSGYDLAPRNLLVDQQAFGTRRDWVKLVDFGLIPMASKQEYTQQRSESGSLHENRYRDPEVVRGAPASHRSAIFSLGKILLAMVTADDPLKDASGPWRQQTARGSINVISPKFAELIGRATDPDISQRPRHWEEVIDTLNDIHP